MTSITPVTDHIHVLQNFDTRHMGSQLWFLLHHVHIGSTNTIKHFKVIRAVGINSANLTTSFKASSIGFILRAEWPKRLAEIGTPEGSLNSIHAEGLTGVDAYQQQAEHLQC